VVDVRDRAAVNRAAEALIKAGTVPDILLNNAGLAAGLAKLQDGDPDDWDRMIDTNLKGLLYVSRALLPAMVARGTGHVVNIGSTAGHQVYQMGQCLQRDQVRRARPDRGDEPRCGGHQDPRLECGPRPCGDEFATVRFHGDQAKAKAVYEGFRPLAPEDVADTIGYVVNLPNT